MQRPATTDSTVTTPRAIAMIKLLGGARFGSIALTRDEFKAIQKLYGFTEEPPTMPPEPPQLPVLGDFNTRYEYDEALREHERAAQRHASWSDTRELLQAGADRNAMRHAEADGLRLVAWLAKFVPRGEDPLKHLVQIVCDAGLDVDHEDLEWAEHEES